MHVIYCELFPDVLSLFRNTANLSKKTKPFKNSNIPINNTPMEGKNKVSNIYGQVYGFAKENIISLDQLYPGDHVAYERVKLYWHHVVVEDIDSERKEVKIIHYYNDVRGFFETTIKELSLAQVMRGSLKFWTKRFYRIVYDEKVVHPPEKVLELARSRLGEAEYHPLTANCEHFCTHCKIGEQISVQVETLIQTSLATIVPTLSRLLLEQLLKKAVQESVKELTKKTTKNIAVEILRKSTQTVFQIAMMRCTGFVGTTVTWVTLQQNTRSVVESVVATEATKLCKSGTEEVVKATARNLGAKRVSQNTPRTKCRMTKSGVLVGVAVEIAFLGKDIHDASLKRNAGEISKEEFEETVIKRVVNTSVSAPMSIAGSIVGQFVLPIPVLGNVIGGITGSVAGKVVGAVLSTTVIKTKERVGKFMKSFSWKRGT